MRLAVLHHLESGAAVASRDVYGEVLEQVQAADQLGYAIAWVAEHHFAAGKGHAPDPLLLLTHLAAQTRQIQLGSAVLPVPFYPPLRLAESVALTDQLSGGRLACGLSSSGTPDEMRAFDARQEGKHDRLRASLHWLRRAWSGEPVMPPNGTEPVTIVPQPVQLLRDLLWIAASSHGAAAVAGDFGYHLLLPSLRPVDSSAEHVATYRRALTAAGHDLQDRHIQSTLHLVLDDDHATAMRLAEPVIWAYYERYVISGAVQRLTDESLPAVMARINFVAGGPEAVAERISAIIGRLGLTHVAFQARLLGLEPQQVLRGLELAAERVLPLLASEHRVPRLPVEETPVHPV